MARTVPLDDRTLAWVRDRFREYYAATPIEPPTRLTRREFASFPFSTETMMRRHASLRDAAEFRSYLTHEAPRHVYYSSAYYRHPAAPTMAAKEWLGADLVFDLDADHLRGAEALGYADQLRRVKERVLALVDDFLFRDFGVDPAATALVFSGGRGYHVHVRDDRFTGLSSPERRELVDYVLGTGIDPLRGVDTLRADVRSGATVAPADDVVGGETLRPGPRTISLAPVEAPGWRGRTTRAVQSVVARWEAEGAASATADLVASGVPPARARRWASELLEHGAAARIRESGTVSFRPRTPGTVEEFLSALVPRARIDVEGETDAPVTTDIHRLIRLPGSRHGGTGLRVVPLERDAVPTFDPFRDALVADGGTTAVEFTAEVDYPFPGGVRGRPGSSDELPTPVATFLLLRGEAALWPSPA